MPETWRAEDVEHRIRRILVSQLEIDPRILTETDPHTPLLGRGIGLDSIEALALVVGIESEFDIEVADGELTVELFESISTLADHVLKKMLAKGNCPDRGALP